MFEFYQTDQLKVMDICEVKGKEYCSFKFMFLQIKIWQSLYTLHIPNLVHLTWQARQAEN